VVWRPQSNRSPITLWAAPRVTAKTHAKDGSVPVSVFRYQCLPDTVDPRGPKGK